jgi:methylthioribose-1-phosphate isomerase
MDSNTNHILWKGNSLLVLDQRRLPRKEVYVRCRTDAQVAEAIRNMTVRGAPLIGCAAAFGMALAAQTGSQTKFKAAAKRLAASRPTAVNLFHAIGAMQEAAGGKSGKELSTTVTRAAVQYYEDDLEFNRKMAKFGASLLPKNARVITYCNAGSLATAGIGTALGVIRQAHLDGKIAHVYPCETRPFLQGSRLTLWELMREKIPSTLITDNMAAHLMKTGKIDAVVVGSDRIAANADVCNKIGTYALAISAKFHGVAFYVAAPSTTVDFNIPTGDRIPIEERSVKEVVEVAGTPIAPKGARAHHFAFDVTPHELVSAIVTEKGIIKPATAANLRAVLGDL